MPSNDHTSNNLKRRPPTRIVRKPVREQMPLALDARARPRLAARRRKFRLIMLSISVLGCLVLVAGLGALSYHGRVTVNDIRIDGTQELDARTLAAAASAVVFDGGFHVFSRANIFLFPDDGIVARLREEFPRIKEISVSRESMLSQAVIVAIEERVPVLTWCSDACYLVDEDGLIFDRTTTPVGYVFHGGLLPGEPIGQHLLLGRLEAVTNVLAELARIGFAPVSVEIENESDYSVRLGAGFDLKLGFDLDTRETIKNVQLLRTAEALAGSDALEYIDLRFGNRVYYKKKGEGQPEETAPLGVPAERDPEPEPN